MVGVSNMTNRSPGCFGNYDFNRIVQFARKRFIEGSNTISMLGQASSDTEREEIALVCMLDVEDDLVLDIQLDCKYATDCKVTNCRDKLRKLIDKELMHR